MRRRAFLRSSVLPVTAMLAGCSRPAPNRRKLRVALAPYITVSPFYVGLEGGYFSEAGFDIEILPDARSEEMIPLVAAGKIDVMFITASASLYNAVLRGGRLRIVAARQFASPTCDPVQNIYVRGADFPDGIADMRPLRGKTIAVRQMFSQFSLDQLLAASGLAPADVQKRQLAPGEALAALEARGVDAVITATELYLEAQKLPFTRGPNLGQILPGFQYSHIVFGPRLLDEDVHHGAAFIQAYLKGAREFSAGKTPQYLENYAKSTGLHPEIVRGICRDTIVPDGSIDRKSFEIFTQWAVANKYVEHTDPMVVVDDRFLKVAVGSL